MTLFVVAVPVVDVKAPCWLAQDIREVEHDVYGKRQDEISFLPKRGQT